MPPARGYKSAEWGEGHDYVVDPETGCWIWQRYINHAGYGWLGRSGRGSGNTLAHRWYYERLKGAIPAGHHLDHLCRVPACVNPAHLEPVTPGENTRRSSHAKMTVETVREARAEYARGGITQRQLAEKYGVSRGAMHSTLKRRNWKDVV